MPLLKKLFPKVKSFLYICLSHYACIAREKQRVDFIECDHKECSEEYDKWEVGEF